MSELENAAKTANPNNCETCQHRQVKRQVGWCYMFRDEPNEICMQHTARDPAKEPPR